MDEPSLRWIRLRAQHRLLGLCTYPVATAIGLQVVLTSSIYRRGRIGSRQSIDRIRNHLLQPLHLADQSHRLIGRARRTGLPSSLLAISTGRASRRAPLLGHENTLTQGLDTVALDQVSNLPWDQSFPPDPPSRLQRTLVRMHKVSRGRDGSDFTCFLTSSTVFFGSESGYQSLGSSIQCGYTIDVIMMDRG